MMICSLPEVPDQPAAELAALVRAQAAEMAAMRARLDQLEALIMPPANQPPAAIPAASPPRATEEWLEPGLIAYRLGLSESHTRRLCSRGQKWGVPGVKKEGGRWLATVDAIKAVWSGQV